MDDLNKTLKLKIDGFNIEDNSIEQDIGKKNYHIQMPEIKQVIWEKINKSDSLVLKK